MNKSFVLAVAVALPMMAFSIPAFSASHMKAGEPEAAKSDGMSAEAKQTMMKECEGADDITKCMDGKMADHMKHMGHMSGDDAGKAAMKKECEGAEDMTKCMDGKMAEHTKHMKHMSGDGAPKKEKSE